MVFVLNDRCINYQSLLLLLNQVREWMLSVNHAGAHALIQALEAIMKGIPLKNYAKDYEVLDLALKQWGTHTPK